MGLSVLDKVFIVVGAVVYVCLWLWLVVSHFCRWHMCSYRNKDCTFMRCSIISEYPCHARTRLTPEDREKLKRKLDELD